VVAVGSNNDEEVRIPKVILDRVQETGDALLTSDAMADNQLSRSKTVVGRSIRSALCVPLRVQDEILGMIHLSSSLATGAYSEVDLELLTAVAQPAALAVAHAQLLTQVQSDARMRSSLSRFLSPALVEKVVKQGMELLPEGELVMATVLFSDIRGFTKLSKGMPPQDVVGLLNEYFEQMVEVVFTYGGTLDKFMGDGLMAVWGTPVQSTTDAFFAAKAADKMRYVLEHVVNKDRQDRGEAPLSAGFGIATGKVVAGGIGGARRQDFTVIGDPVNLASRLCSQAVAGQILVCEQTKEACRQDGLEFKELPAVAIKGIEHLVKVFDMPEDA
jgi:adenylate cyclase